MYFHPTGLQTTTQNHFSHHHHKYIHHDYIHHHIIPPTTTTSSPSSLFTYNINEDFEEPAAAVVVVKAPLLLIAEDLFGMNILLLDCNEIEVIDTFCMYTESEQRRRTQTLRGSSRDMSWSYRHSTLTRRTPDPRSWEKAKTKLLRAPCVSLRLSLDMGKENKRVNVMYVCPPTRYYGDGVVVGHLDDDLGGGDDGHDGAAAAVVHFVCLHHVDDHDAAASAGLHHKIHWRRSRCSHRGCYYNATNNMCLDSCSRCSTSIIPPRIWCFGQKDPIVPKSYAHHHDQDEVYLK